MVKSYTSYIFNTDQSGVFYVFYLLKIDIKRARKLVYFRKY